MNKKNNSIVFCNFRIEFLDLEKKIIKEKSKNNFLYYLFNLFCPIELYKYTLNFDCKKLVENNINYTPILYSLLFKENPRILKKKIKSGNNQIDVSEEYPNQCKQLFIEFIRVDKISNIVVETKVVQILPEFNFSPKTSSIEFLITQIGKKYKKNSITHYQNIDKIDKTDEIQNEITESSDVEIDNDDSPKDAGIKFESTSTSDIEMKNNIESTPCTEFENKKKNNIVPIEESPPSVFNLYQNYIDNTLRSVNHFFDLLENSLMQNQQISLNKPLNDKFLIKLISNLNQIQSYINNLLPDNPNEEEVEYIQDYFEPVNKGLKNLSEKVQISNTFDIDKEKNEIFEIIDSFDNFDSVEKLQMIEKQLFNKRMWKVIYQNYELNNEIENKLNSILKKIFLNSTISDEQLKQTIHDIIKDKIYPFVVEKFNNIINWHQKIDNKRSRSKNEILSIQSKIMSLADIKEIEVKEKKEFYKPELHFRMLEDQDRSLPDLIILNVLRKGYKIGFSDHILIKPGVEVNYNYSG